MRTGALMVRTATLALVAAACGGGGGTIEIGGQQANDHGEEDVAGRSSVQVELDDFYFSPTILSGTAGQTLTLELFNEGENPHTFTIDELGVDVEVGSEERTTAEVTFPDSGAYLVYCRFHADQRMRAALSVGGDLSVGASSGDAEPGGYGGYGGG